MSRSLTISALLPALALAALAATGCSGKAGTGYGSASPERGADYSAPAADPGQSLGSGASFNEGGFSGETAARDAAPAPATAQEESADMDGDAFAQSTKKRSRPGLGTAFGEQRQSQVRDVSFQRDNPLSPDVILSLRYNDAEGVRELARLRGSADFAPAARASAGPLQMTLIDGNGRALPALHVGRETYAVGEPGSRYAIGIENHSDDRFEVVATVDGLDVMDGTDGSFEKRGYVVEPFTSFVIEGYRTNHSSVAAFRFSSIDDSYATRTGRGRDIGVIGAAFFREREGFDRFELERRDHADPFPNR
ncbi:MAG: hypothetical protein R3A51_13780 [Nannocystaceae bacterium]